MGRPGLPASVWALRKKQAIRVISEGGGFDAIGGAWGVSMVHAYVQVHARWPHLAEECKNRRYKCSLSPQEALRRLEIVKRSESQAAAAREIGITDTGLYYWLQRNAPDGIDAALEDYQHDLLDFTDDARAA